MLALPPHGKQLWLVRMAQSLQASTGSVLVRAAQLSSLPLFQVAIIAGNFELAEVIKTHKESDVGEFDLSSPPFSPFCSCCGARAV